MKANVRHAGILSEIITQVTSRFPWRKYHKIKKSADFQDNDLAMNYEFLVSLIYLIIISVLTKFLGLHVNIVIES